jgi:hypothetical protein
MQDKDEIRMADVVAHYCMHCSLYGKEFHYLSEKMHDCVACYAELKTGGEPKGTLEKYKRER